MKKGDYVIAKKGTMYGFTTDETICQIVSPVDNRGQIHVRVVCSLYEEEYSPSLSENVFDVPKKDFRKLTKAEIRKHLVKLL